MKAFEEYEAEAQHSARVRDRQRRWARHRARMARLGVTDLMDPFGNFRVACDYMAELLGRYDVENALTAYNSGHPGHSAYARTVMGYWEELKNG